MKGGDGGANAAQYDEIPYGDVGPMNNGHSGKGQLPQVPSEYSQVPQVPQRQGETFYYESTSTADFMTASLLKMRE